MSAELPPLDGEPYVLADALCKATHPDFRENMTGILAPDGTFYVSCAECKALVRSLLPLIQERETAALEADREAIAASCEAQAAVCATPARGGAYRHCARMARDVAARVSSRGTS